MIIGKYPDGTTYVKETEIGNKIFKINTYEDLWHLTQFVDAYHNEYGCDPTIVIPNLLDAQADRRFYNGESFGLGLILKHLTSLKANFKIFHPHNEEVVNMAFYVKDKKVEIINNSRFISDVFKELKLDNWTNKMLSWNGDNTILMSPDAGAFKPMVKLADKIRWEGDIYSAVKSRDPKTHKLTQVISRSDFGGKDILIIDDLLVGGGTLKGLATLLRSKNVGKLYAAVSHITIQNLGVDPVTNYFDRVFTTNSKYDEYYYRNNFNEEVASQPENLKVFKIF